MRSRSIPQSPEGTFDPAAPRGIPGRVPTPLDAPRQFRSLLHHWPTPSPSLQAPSPAAFWAQPPTGSLRVLASSGTCVPGWVPGKSSSPCPAPDTGTRRGALPGARGEYSIPPHGGRSHAAAAPGRDRRELGLPRPADPAPLRHRGKLRRECGRALTGRGGGGSAAVRSVRSERPGTAALGAGRVRTGAVGAGRAAGPARRCGSPGPSGLACGGSARLRPPPGGPARGPARSPRPARPPPPGGAHRGSCGNRHRAPASGRFIPDTGHRMGSPHTGHWETPIG